MESAAGQRLGVAQRDAGGLPTWENLYDWPNGHGYAGWHSTTTASDDYGLQPALGGQYGLWLWPLGGHKTYDTSDYAEWTYTAPGTTRLETAALSYAWTNKLLAHHCLDVGFRDAGGAVVTHRELCSPPPQSPVDLTLTDPSPNPTAKVLYFRIHVDCGGESRCSRTIPSLDPLKTGAYARLLKVDMTLVDDDAPIAGASGPFFGLSDSYIDGRQSYGLTVSAHDPGSGVEESWLEGNGSLRLLDRGAPCDPTHHTDALDSRICPEYFEYSDAVDTSPLPEGTNTFVVRAQDVAGNVGSSISWRIFVDRTPPAPVSNLRLLAYDSTSATADVGWDQGDDPALADGTPGSGTQYFEYRARVNGGDWSDWATTDEPDALVPAVQLGDNVDLQVRGVDGVGNEAAETDGSVTVYDAGGSLYPYSSPAEDKNTVNSLTDDQISAATDIAESSAAVRDVVGSRSLSASNFAPWATGDGRIVGTTFTLGWADEATLTGPWLSLNTQDDGSYTTSTDSYEADNVTSVDVTVDLDRGVVVSVQPGIDSLVPDSPEPLTMAQFRDARRLAGGSVATATYRRGDTFGVARPVRNLRLINRTLVPGVGNDSWWNWDFNTQSVSPYKSTGGVNVDMPISVVFWGDVDVGTAKDMWNRGQAETHLFADPMHELVHDRPDPGQPSDHREPPTAVWDSDRGAYLGRFAAPRCKMHIKWHYRVYAPSPGSGGDDRLYSPAWGYYVIASSHIDYKEGCSDGWSGDTEATEHRLAAEAPTHTQQHWSILGGCSTSADPWTVEDAATGERRPDTLNLHNKDEVGFDLSHKHLYFNDGMATMIHVLNISHPLWICTH